MSETVRAPTVTANVPCCICGNESSRLFFSRRYDKFNYSGEFHMRRCDGCGLLFCSPRLTDEGIAKLYDANYYVFRKSDADYFARTAAIYQRTITNLPVNSKGPILEVGSGKGYLLAALKGLGWEPFGIEISPDAVAYAKKTFGIEGYAGTIDQYLYAKPDAPKFPAVLCIDIIEHVTDPSHFIKLLSRVIEPNGYLIIDTPNSASAQMECEGANWRGFNPFHIFVFSDGNLTKLLEDNGFIIDKTFTYNNGRAKHNEGIIASIKTWLSRITLRRQVVSAAISNDLASCIKSCQIVCNYSETSDARGEFALDKRGENLIIVARRRS